MNKLLNAYFSKLCGWTIFRILVILMLAAGILLAAALSSTQNAWDVPYFPAFMFFPLCTGIVIGLFNYPIFTNGTARNQISVGHKRRDIFFADWAASNAFSVVLYLVFIAGFFITYSLIADSSGATENISLEAITLSIVLSTVHIMFFATISQIFCIAFKGVKSFLAIYLGIQIIMYSSVIMYSGGTSALAGKFNLPEKLMLFSPTGVCMNMCNSFSVDSDFIPALVIMIAETVIVYFIGAMYIQKTDLN